MIPSSLELNSDDFPFFGNLKRTSGSREKLEKSSFENRDNHHQPRDETMMMIRKPKSVARCQKLGQCWRIRKGFKRNKYCSKIVERYKWQREIVVIFMRERFVIESGWQLNQIFWFGSKNTALPFLLSLPLQPANGEYPRTLPEYDNFYDDLMTIKTLYDDEKIAMMMLSRWWRFFHSFPTDWSMQTKRINLPKYDFRTLKLTKI